MLSSLLKLLGHNPVSNRIRQIACGWRCVKFKGVIIWYKPIKVYPGYKDFDYDGMFMKAFGAVRRNRKKFPGKRVAVLPEAFYSGGRPGIGVRKVSYAILPYKEVF